MTELKKTNGNGVVSSAMCAPYAPCLNLTFLKTRRFDVSSINKSDFTLTHTLINQFLIIAIPTD